MRVTAVMGGPYVHAIDGAIHLDGVLSMAACAAINSGPNQDFDGAVVPIPLRLLWVCQKGRPLWAASDLRPVGETGQAKSYWHSRYPADRADLSEKIGANTSAGRWKDYRVPMSMTLAHRLEALCVGVPEHVEKLLTQHVTHIGKKTSQGKGRVLQWTVDPLPLPIDDAIEAIISSRPVPLDYFRETASQISGRIVPRAGWTPPYWDARYHTEVVHG